MYGGGRVREWQRRTNRGWEQQMKVSLSRRYRFAASHRLHSRRFDAQTNRRLYGKCDSPYGHGHNYTVEVTFTGPIDPSTGMIANLGELDPFVEREVIEAFDHKYLNEEIAAFRDRVPTTENVAREIFYRLRAFPKARLERVRIEETSKNSFEYRGEGAGDGADPAAQG
jgi:6-pyruvoyltetrahydropterin/6-carboxytetrahydropterin synthase